MPLSAFMQQGAPPSCSSFACHGGGGKIELRWDDFADLSEVVPLLARIYPNGSADVNHFHAAGDGLCHAWC